MRGTPADIGLEYEELRLTSADGTEVPLWHIPAAGNIEVVFFHGNAENITRNLETYTILHECGVTIWAAEYRGYYTAGGSPSEAAIESDLQTLGEYLRQRVSQDTTKLVAMGRSLGGAVAVKFASLFEVDALILESTFTSMREMARRSFGWLPVGLILSEHYPGLKLLAGLDCPTLVLHSREDGLIPFQMGQRLAQANRQSRLVEISGPHNGGFLQSEAVYRGALADFFAELH